MISRCFKHGSVGGAEGSFGRLAGPLLRAGRAGPWPRRAPFPPFPAAGGAEAAP